MAVVVPLTVDTPRVAGDDPQIAKSQNAETHSRHLADDGTPAPKRIRVIELTWNVGLFIAETAHIKLTASCQRFEDEIRKERAKLDETCCLVVASLQDLVDTDSYCTSPMSESSSLRHEKN